MTKNLIQIFAKDAAKLIYMIRELWSTFPRLLVERINALLDEAEPSSAKAFQLYKTCQSENLWNDTFEKFSRHLSHFFSLNKFDRRKSVLDAVLDAPMSQVTFNEFQLNFRNAIVENRSIINLASWAHHLMRVGHKTNSIVISEDVLCKTFNYITHPPLFEKAANINFEDFCEAWQKTVFKLFGKQYDEEFQKILSELQWLNAQLIAEEQQPEKRPTVFPTIYLTQTEIDWTVAVKQAAEGNIDIPKYPLSRGPQKPRLIDLLRTVQLYKIVETSKLPEFLEHKEKIRATIIDRCSKLLRDKAS